MGRAAGEDGGSSKGAGGGSRDPAGGVKTNHFVRRRSIMASTPQVSSDRQAPNRAEHIRSVTEQVRALIEGIPGFTFLTLAQIRRLGTAAAVSDEFLDVGARAMESRPALDAAAQLRPEALRLTIEESHAMVALIAEMERLTRGCRHTDALSRGAAGTEVLRVYQVAQKLTRHGDLEDNATWVQQLKAAWNRRRS
jgi:hypothetical protein